MKIVTTDEKRLLSETIVNIQGVKVHPKKTYLSPTQIFALTNLAKNTDFLLLSVGKVGGKKIFI